MGDVFEEVGDFLSDVGEAVGPVLGPAAVGATAVFAPELLPVVLPIALSTGGLLGGREEPAPPVLQITQAPPTIHLDLAPFVSGFGDILREQTSLFPQLLSAVVNPLTQSTLQETEQLRFLNQLLGGEVFRLFQEFVGADRASKEILIPTLSGASVGLFQIIKAIMTGQDVPPESILQVFREALILFGRTASPEVRQWLPHITRFLTVLLPELTGRRGRILKALDPEEGEAGSELVRGFAADQERQMEQAIPRVNQALGSLRILFQRFAQDLGSFALEGMAALHTPMAAVLEGSADVLFRRLDDELEGLREATPERVMDNAARLLGIAGGLGMSAHLTSVIAEMVVVFKHLGLPQLAAFLVDLSGFSKIGQHTFGVQFETALRSPSLRRARARFRSELPDPITMEQLFLKKRISEATYRQFLREQGWSEEFIDGHLNAVFRPPRPIDLAFAIEDAEVSEEWVQRQLSRSGLDDESVENMLKALRARGQRTARGTLLTSVHKAAQDGVISAGLAAEYLHPLRLKDDTLQLVLTAINLDRYHEEQLEQRRVLLDQATLGQLTPEDLQAELAALGFDERAATQTGRLARRKRGLRLFREEAADVKAAIRRAQAHRIQTALDQHRRFLIEDDELRGILLGHGIREEEVESLVSEAGIRREPVPRLADVLSPEAQRQRELLQLQEQILALQRNETIDEGTSVALQMALGVDRGEAQREAGIVAAHLTRPPEPEKPTPEPPEVRELRHVRTDTALRRFRSDVVSPEILRAELSAAGHKPEVVSSLVDREVTRKRTAEARTRARAAERQLRDELRALEDAAVASFRRGDLGEGGLFHLFLALGRAPDVAEALVGREVARKPAPKAEAAG